MAYAAISFVFGEQPSTAKWNILGTNDASFNDGTGIATGKILPNHLVTGASTLNTWVWDSWTPTLANLTLGNGSSTGAYLQRGKTIDFRWTFILGTTSAVGTNPSFTLPAATKNSVGTQGIEMFQASYADDSAGTVGPLASFMSSTTVCRILAINAAGTYATVANVTSTVPITWATSDYIFVSGTYEVA